MDIIYDGREPDFNLPYFGKQARFFEFFKECITPYMPANGIYAETNSGSVYNAFKFAQLGYKVIVNDIAEYSNAIANSIFNNDSINKNDKCIFAWLNNYKNSYIDRASIMASIIENYGYNAPIPHKNNVHLAQTALNYQALLHAIKNKGIKAYKIYNEDLYDYLQILMNANIKVDVMFMDFAWPWRNGSKTNEYDTMANNMSGVFNGKRKMIEMWTQENVINNVIHALNLAKNVSKYIFLSNQSSNYPTPEILEVALLMNGFKYEIRHTMLTNATREDNLLTETFFREYLYVIKC